LGCSKNHIDRVVDLLSHADELDDAAIALRREAGQMLRELDPLSLAEVAHRAEGWDLATLQILTHGLQRKPRRRR